jgi:hypothetical protein
MRASTGRGGACKGDPADQLRYRPSVVWDMTGLTKALPNTLPRGWADDAAAGAVRDDGRGTLDALPGAGRVAQPANPITATASATRALS